MLALMNVVDLQFQQIIEHPLMQLPLMQFQQIMLALRKVDATSTDAIEHPCAALFEETKGNSVKQKTVSSPQNQNADSVGRWTDDDIDSTLDHTNAKLNENIVASEFMQPGRHSGSNVGPWPHKRRKTDGQQSNSLPLSSSLKVNIL